MVTLSETHYEVLDNCNDQLDEPTTQESFDIFESKVEEDDCDDCQSEESDLSGHESGPSSPMIFSSLKQSDVDPGVFIVDDFSDSENESPVKCEVDDPELITSSSWMRSSLKQSDMDPGVFFVEDDDFLDSEDETPVELSNDHFKPSSPRISSTLQESALNSGVLQEEKEKLIPQDVCVLDSEQEISVKHESDSSSEGELKTSKSSICSTLKKSALDPGVFIEQEDDKNLLLPHYVLYLEHEIPVKFETFKNKLPSKSTSSLLKRTAVDPGVYIEDMEESEDKISSHDVLDAKKGSAEFDESVAIAETFSLADLITPIHPSVIPVTCPAEQVTCGRKPLKGRELFASIKDSTDIIINNIMDEDSSVHRSSPKFSESLCESSGTLKTGEPQVNYQHSEYQGNKEKSGVDNTLKQNNVVQTREDHLGPCSDRSEKEVVDSVLINEADVGEKPHSRFYQSVDWSKRYKLMKEARKKRGMKVISRGRSKGQKSEKDTGKYRSKDGGQIFDGNGKQSEQGQSEADQDWRPNGEKSYKIKETPEVKSERILLNALNKWRRMWRYDENGTQSEQGQGEADQEWRPNGEKSYKLGGFNIKETPEMKSQRILLNELNKWRRMWRYDENGQQSEQGQSDADQDLRIRCGMIDTDKTHMQGEKSHEETVKSYKPGVSKGETVKSYKPGGDLDDRAKSGTKCGMIATNKTHSQGEKSHEETVKLYKPGVSEGDLDDRAKSETIIIDKPRTLSEESLQKIEIVEGNVDPLRRSQRRRKIRRILDPSLGDSEKRLKSAVKVKDNSRKRPNTQRVSESSPKISKVAQDEALTLGLCSTEEDDTDLETRFKRISSSGSVNTPYGNHPSTSFSREHVKESGERLEQLIENLNKDDSSDSEKEDRSLDSWSLDESEGEHVKAHWVANEEPQDGVQLESWVLEKRNIFNLQNMVVNDHAYFLHSAGHLRINEDYSGIGADGDCTNQVSEATQSGADCDRLEYGSKDESSVTEQRPFNHKRKKKKKRGLLMKLTKIGSQWSNEPPENVARKKRRKRKRLKGVEASSDVDDRCADHNATERQRRKEMRQSFRELAQVLDLHLKEAKIRILNTAAAECRHLQDHLQNLMVRKSSLQRQVLRQQRLLLRYLKHYPDIDRHLSISQDLMETSKLTPIVTISENSEEDDEGIEEEEEERNEEDVGLITASDVTRSGRVAAAFAFNKL